jgi:hypothetical protein
MASDTISLEDLIAFSLKETQSSFSKPVDEKTQVHLYEHSKIARETEDTSASKLFSLIHFMKHPSVVPKPATTTNLGFKANL